MLEGLTSYILSVILQFGYLGIFIGMLIESSFIPFPSEIIMIPAGYLVFEEKMNLIYVIVCGVLGSLGGAIINYYLGMHIGRPLLLKFGKYFFISEKSFTKSENFFKNHGAVSTLTGRLLPGIRQIISIPAGIFHMNIFLFLFLTCIGSLIWVTILTLLGFLLGQNQMAIKENLFVVKILIILTVFVCVGVYIYFKKYFNKK